MTHAIKVLHKWHLPGHGFHQDTGAPVSTKQLIVGHIDISSYTESGEVVTPSEFGLNTVDYITFDSEKERTITDNATYALHYWYERSTHLLRAIDFRDNPTEATSTLDIGWISFLAVGDSATAPALL